MYKKTLSGLGFMIFMVFTPVIACNNSSPGTNPSSALVNNTTSDNASPVAKNETGSTQISGNQNINTDSLKSPVNSLNPVDGNLTNKAADANPAPVNPIATPTPSSTATVSPAPSPTATVISGASGQLNIIINPIPPCKKGDPGC